MDRFRYHLQSEKSTNLSAQKKKTKQIINIYKITETLKVRKSRSDDILNQLICTLEHKVVSN